jgi:hypothetical protein
MELVKDRVIRLSSATKSARQNWEDTRKSRDAAIADADAEGVSLREIARLAELGASHVQRIVAEETIRRQEASKQEG